MQFPVPQFTDVEDKIIGSLTIKQFGIIFGTGVLVFVGFTLTKSVIVLIFCAILFGLPGLGLAFAKLNGRPMYNMIGYFINFLTSPKILVFHKEAMSADDEQNNKKTEPVKLVDTVAAVDPQTRLKEVNLILQKQAEEERVLVGNKKQQ